MNSGSNVKEITDFSIPYSSAGGRWGYGVSVKATSKYGEVSYKSASVSIPMDQPPSLSVYIKECYPYCGFGCEGAYYVPFAALIKAIDPDTDIGDPTAPYHYSYWYSGGINIESKFSLPWSGGVVDLPIDHCPAEGYRH